MGFFDYAWNRCVKISRKNPEDISIFSSTKQKYPVLSSDQQGLSIHLPEPEKTKRGLWSFEGMTFRDTLEGRRSLWRTFLATVDHLSLHLAYSDFSSYSGWGKGKDIELATFVTSLVEDSLIQARSAIRLPSIAQNQAYANVISYLRLKPPRYIWSPSMKIQSAILSKLTVGMVEGLLQEDIAKSTDTVIARLKSLEERIRYSEHSSEDLNRIKLEAADEIYRELEKYGEPPEAAALPYRESHGGERVLRDISESTSETEFERLLDQAGGVLGLAGPRVEGSLQSDANLDIDADSVFSRWEAQMVLRKKILTEYAGLARDTHFSSIAFPPDDYGRYLRIRSDLTGPIRRIADQVRQIKNQEDEVYRAEAGMVDMQEAIQVIASKTMRSDIFTREEPVKKNEAWSILIDLSGSTGGVDLETKGSAICLAESAAICLAEVTNAVLSSGGPWGLYGFGERFYVVKDFLEDYSAHIKARLGGIRPGGLTYLPDAIKITAKILKAHSGDSRNFMLIVSDGLPTGYSRIEEDLEEVIYDVERSGVIPLAVGLNTKRIKRFFRHYCTVSNPYELMKSFVRSYLELSSTIQG